jgi:hypothetical protein
MKTDYSPSINIIRDTDREINYITTPNSIRVVNHIIDDFRKGIRAFNIIGSYGTGKSSFLVALEQSLRGSKSYFTAKFLQTHNFTSIKIIGSYKSIVEDFASQFNVSVKSHITENIFSELFNKYHDLGKKSPFLLIMIDEFGKYLEYAAQNQPEKELYFIQQLAEFASNPKHNIVLITTVHQSFESYSYGLSNSQRQEWIKVKGRYKEVTFNEPVEQLLFLASQHINESYEKRISKTELDTSYSTFCYTKAFAYNEAYIKEIYTKLYPLDLFSSFVLTISLQRYGQNERSLFSFLESTDHTSISKFAASNSSFFNLANVYDYLHYNFYSFLSSKYNPDFSAWSSIKASLEEVERAFEDEQVGYFKIVKAIGLLNIFAAAGSKLDKHFYAIYAKNCMGINDAGKLIDNLVSKKILIFRKHSQRYVLFEGTDLDIQTALIEAADKVSEITDVSTLLKKYFEFPTILAKEYSYIVGTPRYFEFRITEIPIHDEFPTGEIDGFINLIFNENLSLNKVKSSSQDTQEAIIYGFYRNSKEIKNLLYEIEKTQKVLDENKEDKVAKRELENILLHQKILLNHYIMNNLFSVRNEVTWIFGGKEIAITSKKEFNKKLTEICLHIYSQTPVYKLEMVNKQKMSSAIQTAKKNYFRALVDNWNKPELGFDIDKFPPEKTIYLTLLKENGLELFSDKIGFCTNISENSSFISLWKFSEEFLYSAKSNRRRISDFFNPLTRRPFKLKQGLIDFWIASFLFIKRDDYALFGESGYIPYITDEILELIIKYPDEYELKAFDIEGVKLDLFNSYRLFLNKDLKGKITNQTFIETIKPFLTFYKDLPEYTRTTNRLRKETLAIRLAIANARDPEQTFFENFPHSLGYSIENLQNSKADLQDYILKMQEAIRELRTNYDALLNRFEEFILTEFVGENVAFEEYKTRLQKRFKKLKKHLCLPHQKVFVQRLDSQIDDRRAWLNSIAQVVIGKSLSNIKDEDEIILYDGFKSLILELDTLTNISKVDIDDFKEEVLAIEMSSFVNGIHKKLIRLPKTKQHEVKKIEDEIKLKLARDRVLNIAAIANILKELLEK